MCRWSVCIEETMYWTALANQTQDTVHYFVSNIHLTYLAHGTRSPYCTRNLVHSFHVDFLPKSQALTMVQFLLVCLIFTSVLTNK